eukprot:TRINITY_DN31834_c0_g1_i1.p1 TRINITY_DN31834_c0_g1~~TRINITY_DN31834_c0_g1_i1.p1  ORF type:complete len:530 (+),score=99.19 TRINITY_DN31834_c0_g1_i1:53-1591(+)
MVAARVMLLTTALATRLQTVQASYGAYLESHGETVTYGNGLCSLNSIIDMFYGNRRRSDSQVAPDHAHCPAANPSALDISSVAASFAFHEKDAEEMHQEPEQLSWQHRKHEYEAKGKEEARESGWVAYVLLFLVLLQALALLACCLYRESAKVAPSVNTATTGQLMADSLAKLHQKQVEIENALAQKAVAGQTHHHYYFINTPRGDEKQSGWRPECLTGQLGAITPAALFALRGNEASPPREVCQSERGSEFSPQNERKPERLHGQFGTAPAAPCALQVDEASITFDAMRVQWSDPIESPIPPLPGTAYCLQRRRVGDEHWVQIYEGADKQYLSEGLKHATHYQFRVSACNASGLGPWSSECSATTKILELKASLHTQKSSTDSGVLTLHGKATSNDPLHDQACICSLQMSRDKNDWKHITSGKGLEVTHTLPDLNRYFRIEVEPEKGWKEASDVLLNLRFEPVKEPAASHALQQRVIELQRKLEQTQAALKLSQDTLRLSESQIASLGEAL